MLKNTAFPPFFNGDGSDGRVIINVPTTLTSTQFYDSLVVKNTSLVAGGYRIFSKGLVKVSRFGSIVADGAIGTDSGAGGGFAGVGGVGAPTAELGGGGNGGGNVDGNTPASGDISPTLASLGGNGGNSNGGQATWIFGNRASLIKRFEPIYSGIIQSLLFTSSWTTVSGIISGGGGGGAGNSGNKGLPGGGGGGIVWIAADTIWLGNDSLISAKGGDGIGYTTPGWDLDGGGGGGGGAILLFCNTLINDGGMLDVSGGMGGVGNDAGVAGGNGINGIIVVFTPQGIQISTSGTLIP